MENFNYWKESLQEALPDRILTTKEVKDIIRISEMEYEYTSAPFTESEPKAKENTLKNEIRILEKVLCKYMNVDSVRVVGEGVEWFKREGL